MTTQQNLEVVQEFFRVLRWRRVNKGIWLLAEDVDWYYAGSDAIPYAGRWRGQEGVAEFFVVLTEAVETDAFEPQRFIVQGDSVVVLGYERSRVRSTGRWFENNWAMVFTLRDDAIAQFIAYGDTAAMA